MRDEMRKANYKSVRGPYKYGNNHFPIQNFYLQDVVKDADGDLTLKTVATIVKDSQDKHHEQVPDEVVSQLDAACRSLHVARRRRMRPAPRPRDAGARAVQ